LLTICYPSGSKEPLINNPHIATLIKYFALELNEQAYKSLLNIPEANQVIKQAFIANLNNEMENLVSSSVLRNSSFTDLTAFRLET